MNEKDYNEQIRDIQNVEGLNLFCHFTDQDGQSFLDEGLYLAEPKWYTTMLEVDEQERKDMLGFLDDQIGNENSLNWKHTAIILGVPEEDGYDFIDSGISYSFDLSDLPYRVSPQYVMCSIDLNNKEITYNENSIGYSAYLADQFGTTK